MAVSMTPKRFIIILCPVIIAANAQNYTWPQYTNMFDCMVGITVDDKPISSGVYVHYRHIWTAANPLEQYVNQMDRIAVYSVNIHYNMSKKLVLDNIHGNQLERLHHSWIPVGFDRLHKTVHDILCITMKYLDNVRPFTIKYPYERRLPFVQRTPTMTYSSEYFYTIPGGPLNTRGWSIAGFGFIDMRHVRENVQMEVVDYFNEDVLVDCDEWIPREWGCFICLLNVDNFVGIAAGAGLFYNQTLFGLGSFSLTKGDESILLFTDLRIYRHGPINCKPIRPGIQYNSHYYDTPRG